MSEKFGEREAKKRHNEAIAAEGDVATMQQEAPKRVKTEGVLASKRPPCLLLDFGPEIMRKVLSFLTLQDGLKVRRTCKQLHTNDTAKDVFRYCCIVDHEKLTAMGYDNKANTQYTTIQRNVLCNLGSLDKLRAVLQNETLGTWFAGMYIWLFIWYSKTDDAEAASILLQDDRCRGLSGTIAEALRKNYTNIAAALQQDVRAMLLVEWCAKCSSNIACYPCEKEDEACPSKGSRFCRSCVLEDSFGYCKYTNTYICPRCVGRLHDFYGYDYEYY